VIQKIEHYFQRILQCSLKSDPEKILNECLTVCMELSGACSGSIFGEDGPFLKILFSDSASLIGTSVPWNSIAGATSRSNKVIYTYAPADKRHYAGVDKQTSRQTHYLISIPITSVYNSVAEQENNVTAGVLQLLFRQEIVPCQGNNKLPIEFTIETIREQECFEQKLKDIFWILPNIAFAMEVMRLRQTSYQIIHELKNKLIATESWINCLKEDIQELAPKLLQHENIQEDIVLAETSAQEGACLARGYLQFTKLYNPVFQETNINNLVLQTVATLKAFANELKGPSINIDVELGKETFFKTIDASQIKIALFNLGKNAVEALKLRRKKNGKLLFALQKKGNYLQIIIADNGDGMPDEIIKNLFIAFKTKKEGGTGLGLTIAKKIVDIHGGIIFCNSDKDGTIFTIQL